MARHSKSVNISLARAGRPVADKPLIGPDCKICRHLDLSKVGPAGCLKGHEIDASRCGSFKDSSRERQLYGGLTGIFTP